MTKKQDYGMEISIVYKDENSFSQLGGVEVIELSEYYVKVDGEKTELDGVWIRKTINYVNNIPVDKLMTKFSS